MTKTYEKDLTRGPILKQLIMYTLPLIAMNVLQMLFNVADIAVLGIFVSDEAVGAVGSTTALVTLCINLFVGLSVGSNVILSKCVGENDKEKAKRVVGTSIVISLVAGVFLAIVGFFCAETFLRWMDCSENLIGMASLYLKIYFLGMPIMMLYNFSAAILRAVGDTFRPMLFLIIAGGFNVGLNIFFVLVFDMTVEGVALGTILSQAIAGVLALIVVVKGDGFSKLYKKHFRIYKAELWQILKVGIPSGIQSTMFSISNVMIQSTVNTFGDAGITGNSVANQFDQFPWMIGNSIAVASLSFTSQNVGACNHKRIKKVVSWACMLGVVFPTLLGGIILLLAEPLCSIISSSPEVIAVAKQRLGILCLTYGICAIMDVSSNVMRGLGKSTTAMIISVIFICVFRIIWLNTVYLLNPTYSMIFISYPVTWALCAILNMFIIIPHIKKKEKIEKNVREHAIDNF